MAFEVQPYLEIGEAERLVAPVLSPDGERLSAIVANQVGTWDLLTGAELSRHPYEGEPARVWYAEGERLVLSVAAVDRAELWEDSSRALRAVLEVGEEWLDPLMWAASPFGARFALASWDSLPVIRIFEAATGRRLAELSPLPDESVEDSWTGGMRFSRRGALLAIRYFASNVQLFDVESGGHRGSLTHGRLVGATIVPYAVADFGFSPDGAQLVSAGSGLVRSWSLPDFAETLTIEVEGDDDHLAFSPAGALIAVGGNRSPLTLLSLETGAAVHRVTLDTGVRTMAFSPDGRMLALSLDGLGERLPEVRVIDMRRGDELARLTHPEGVHYLVAFHHDGAHLLASTGTGSVAVWRLVPDSWGTSP